MLKEKFELIIVAIMLLMAGCSSEETKDVESLASHSPALAKFSEWQPGQRLHPYQMITPGMSVSKIREAFPEMGEPQAEGGSPTLKQRGLTEFSTQVTFDDKPVGAEFNFRHDTLYSYYFTVGQPQWSTRDRTRWHKMLVEEWTRAFGSTTPEEQVEGAYQAKTYFWQNPKFDAVITLSQTADSPPIVSWGVQEPRD